MITLLLVLSLACILKGVALIMDGLCEWACPDPPAPDDLDEQFTRYRRQRERDVFGLPSPVVRSSCLGPEGASPSEGAGVRTRAAAVNSRRGRALDAVFYGEQKVR